MTNFSTIAIIAAICFASDAFSFGIVSPKSGCRPSTKLFLEDRIAEMIDQELFRLTHLKEKEEEWVNKNKMVIEKNLPENFDFATAFDTGLEKDQDINLADTMNKVGIRRDINLAKRDPQKYCADRCVSTGNCDVFEDMFDLTPEQVISFCTECVLSEEEEPCDVPEKFLKP
jgi:hypothetical protein